MFHTDLVDAAKAACRALGTGDCNLDGWFQRAARAVRMMTKQWGGKAPDDFDTLWNAVVAASARKIDVKDLARETAVFDCYSWLMDYFSFKDGDLENDRDRERREREQRNDGSGDGGRTESLSPGRESGAADAGVSDEPDEPTDLSDATGDTEIPQHADDENSPLRAPD